MHQLFLPGHLWLRWYKWRPNSDKRRPRWAQRCQRVQKAWLPESHLSKLCALLASRGRTSSHQWYVLILFGKILLLSYIAYRFWLRSPPFHNLTGNSFWNILVLSIKQGLPCLSWGKCLIPNPREFFSPWSFNSAFDISPIPIQFSTFLFTNQWELIYLLRILYRVIGASRVHCLGNSSLPLWFSWQRRRRKTNRIGWFLEPSFSIW